MRQLPPLYTTDDTSNTSQYTSQYLMLMTLKKKSQKPLLLNNAQLIFLIQINLLVPSRLPQRLLGQIVKAPCCQRQYCFNKAMRLNQLSSTRNHSKPHCEKTLPKPL